MNRRYIPESEPGRNQKIQVFCNKCNETGLVAKKVLDSLKDGELIVCQHCGDGRMCPIPEKVRLPIQEAGSYIQIFLN